jgi:hypothetical protein
MDFWKLGVSRNLAAKFLAFPRRSPFPKIWRFPGDRHFQKFGVSPQIGTDVPPERLYDGMGGDCRKFWELGNFWDSGIFWGIALGS